MSFFITSAGSGDGANLGGLAGADKICQTLAAAAGAGGKTWHAYLSAAAANGQPAVNARDRIGKGPWFNAKGVQVAASVADLHSDDQQAGEGWIADREGGGRQRPRRHAEHARHPDRIERATERCRARPTTPAATGPRTPPPPASAPRASAITTSRAAATRRPRGTRRTTPAPAASRTWSRRAGQGCSTASRSTRRSRTEVGYEIAGAQADQASGRRQVSERSESRTCRPGARS